MKATPILAASQPRSIYFGKKNKWAPEKVQTEYEKLPSKAKAFVNEELRGTRNFFKDLFGGSDEQLDKAMAVYKEKMVRKFSKWNKFFV